MRLAEIGIIHYEGNKVPDVSGESTLLCALSRGSRHRKLSPGDIPGASSLECFSERGSSLRGSADAGSRRKAGRAAAQPLALGLLGRSCHSAAVHPSSLFPFFPVFFFLPISVISNTRDCCPRTSAAAAYARGPLRRACTESPLHGIHPEP